MRYLFSVTVVLLMAAFARAQSAPQGPTEVSIGTHEAPTNQVAAAEPAPAEGTNRVDSARAAFLMDTGVQYADEGEYKEAEQAYQRALKNAPDDPDIRFRLGTLYILMKKYPEAVKMLEKLSAEIPDIPGIHNNLAWVYASGDASKNAKLSLRHAREAILIEPYSASLWNTLAEAYYVSGEYDKALRASDFALELLKIQNGSEKSLTDFEAQRTKIQRADETYKRMFGLDDERK